MVENSRTQSDDPGSASTPGSVYVDRCRGWWAASCGGSSCSRYGTRMTTAQSMRPHTGHIAADGHVRTGPVGDISPRPFCWTKCPTKS